jgi:hypothetical protein
MINLSACYYVVSDPTSLRNMDYLTNGLLIEWAMRSLKRMLEDNSSFISENSC